MKKLVDSAEFIKSPPLRFFYRLVQPLVDRLTGFYQINQIYANVRKKGPDSTVSFCTITLEEFEASVEVEPAVIQALQSDGPLLIVANHPYGCIDAMAVIELVGKTFPRDWKMAANQLLRNVDEIADNMIPVSPHADGAERTANLSAIKTMHKLLKRNGAVVMFPAARVSSRNQDYGFVCDLPWTAHPLKLAIQHGAKLVNIHLSGKNSDAFLSVPADNIKRRSLALAKEVPKQKNKKLKISLSSVMTPERAKKINVLANKEEILRAYNYIGADKTPATPAKSASADLSAFRSDSDTDFNSLLQSSQELLIEQAGFSSFCIEGKAEPLVMEEIGRLREKTFQFIGTGSGNEIDLSDEDAYYHHIVVTEKATGKIAGAYRVGFSQPIIESRGVEALYLNNIFEIDPQFHEKMGNAAELSRSFIPPEFQKSPQVLDILWKALGKVARQRDCKIMYGSVTISADFTPLSKAILVHTLEHFHAADEALRSLVKNTNPFVASTEYHPLLADAYGPHGLNKLNTVIEELEEGHRPIPPLMRYYATLGAKFLSFKVEPSFGNAIYCLLTVDLEAIPPRYRKRFLGQ